MQQLLSSSPSSVWSKQLCLRPPFGPRLIASLNSPPLQPFEGFPNMPPFPPGPPHCPFPAVIPSSVTSTATQPELHHFFCTHSLRTLQRDLRCNYEKSLHASLPSQIPTFPKSPPYPQPDAVSNSLLTPLTSFPLASAPQSDPDFPSLMQPFALPFLGKFAFQSFLWTTPHLKCGTRLDPFGDHFFACVRHSKSHLSNSMHNALWAICQCTTSLAEVTDSFHHVLLEPQHRSLTFPLSRLLILDSDFHPPTFPILPFTLLIS